LSVCLNLVVTVVEADRRPMPGTASQAASEPGLCTLANNYVTASVLQ